MTDLAAALGAPGLRVFGDTTQPGADRTSTRSWIAESIQKLDESAKSKGIEIWLETRGDFAGSNETAAILQMVASPLTGVLWDPEGTKIRHVHLKDLRHRPGSWDPVLTGEGDFALHEVRTALQQLNYDRFLSLEWEKKWRPGIADAEIALPHFVRWFRENWNHA
jgi:sugar phosphate isomerase/epimerase